MSILFSCPGFFVAERGSRSPVILVLMSKFPNEKYPGVQEMHRPCTSFPGPIWRDPVWQDGGLRSRLPNGSEKQDAPVRCSAAGSPGTPLTENFGPCRASCQTRRSQAAGCVSDPMIPARLFYRSESLHQMMGSINNFLRERRESWPRDSIDGWG